jgi:hypothetical protein
MTPFLNSVKVHVRLVSEHNDVATGVRDTRVHFLHQFIPRPANNNSSCADQTKEKKITLCMDGGGGGGGGRLVRNRATCVA